MKLTIYEIGDFLKKYDRQIHDDTYEKERATHNITFVGHFIQPNIITTTKTLPAYSIPSRILSIGDAKNSSTRMLYPWDTIETHASVTSLGKMKSRIVNTEKRKTSVENTELTSYEIKQKELSFYMIEQNYLEYGLKDLRLTNKGIELLKNVESLAGL